MTRFVLGLLLGGSILLVSQPASAVEFCLELSGFDNLFRLEALDLGANTFALAGQDRVFEERPVSGTLYVGDTFAVIGFSSYAAGVTAHFRAVLSLATASGPYSLVVHNSSAIATGTAAAISCAAVPAATVAGAGRSARGDVLSAMPK